MQQKCGQAHVPIKAQQRRHVCPRQPHGDDEPGVPGAADKHTPRVVEHKQMEGFAHHAESRQQNPGGRALPQRRAEKPCSQQKEGKIIGEKRHIPQRKRSLNIASGIGVQIFEKCDLFPRYIENMAVAKSAEDTAEEKQHGQEQREFLPCKLRAAAGQQNDRQKR